jgi:hypothetical protein
MSRIKLLGLALLISSITFAQNSPLSTLKVRIVENDITKWTSDRPDGFAPFGVNGDHIHKKGEFMFSYTAQNIGNNSLQSGGVSVSEEYVFGLDYSVSPTSMSMGIDKFGIMYAPTNKLTVMVMGAYLNKSLDMQLSENLANTIADSNAVFKQKSSGLGDIKLIGLYQLRSKYKKAFHLNIGVSIPTGSVTQSSTNPMSTSTEVRQPYIMQLGSGSVDPIIGATYLVQKAKWSYGLQSINTLRIFENSEGYRQSSQLLVNFWHSRKISDLLSASIRVEENFRTAIIGSDANLNPKISPTHYTYNSSSSETLIYIGVNSYLYAGNLKGLRIAFELGFPSFSYYRGTQLANNGSALAGIHYSF